ncbi:MAG: GNAT family N-acetyltransferase [Chloroflexota bacterium]
MATITVTVREQSHPNLRPLNVLRDLPNVADLIELCFSNTMDSEGQRYIQDMRQAGRDASFLNWANRAAESTSLPLTGYIWEENGKIVGNASLVPFRHNRKRLYLIANVATHPDHRRRGIARALTERALVHARAKKIDSIWLHVRDDNPGAIQLYTDLGFVERARRTSWQSTGDAKALPERADISISSRHPHWWPLQQEWLARLYPDALAWHRSWSFAALRPGLWNWLYLFFVDMNFRQWVALKSDELEAALAWIPSGRGESLFLAAGQRSDPDAVTALLLHARRTLSQQRYLSIEFPTGEFESALLNAGFHPQRTLIWMQAAS